MKTVPVNASHGKRLWKPAATSQMTSLKMHAVPGLGVGTLCLQQRRPRLLESESEATAGRGKY